MVEGKKISMKTLKRNGWKEDISLSGYMASGDIQLVRGRRYRFYNTDNQISTEIFDRSKESFGCISSKKK